MGPPALLLHWTREMAARYCTELLRGCFFKSSVLFGNLLAATSPCRVEEAKEMVSKAHLLVQKCKACSGSTMAHAT